MTAQRRKQRLQDVGIAVTALGKQDIAVLGRRDVSSLTTQVPSLQVTQFAPTLTVFNLRGIAQNDFADSEEGPVAFYSDEVYISSLGAISGQNFDLQRVEVLRGPQGTLFGRNATGGLIQFISAKPTDQLTGFATFTAGSYGEIGSEAAVSGPVSSTTNVRLSFASDEHDGFIHNGLGPNPGGLDQYQGRFQVQQDLGDAGDLLLKAAFIRNDHDTSAGGYYTAPSVLNADGLGTLIGPDQNVYGCPGCFIGGYHPTGNIYSINDNSPNRFDRTFLSLTATYTKRFDSGITLTSISDYENLMKGYEEDSDATPESLLIYSNRQHLYQASEEVRLSGDSDRLHWTAGLYGLHIRTQNEYDANFALFDLNGKYGGILNTWSGAAFGQAEYKIANNLSIIGGARYSYDEKTLDFHQQESDLPGQVFLFNQSTYPNYAKRDFADWSGKIELDYKPMHDLLFYVSENKGTKSGGFSTIGFQPINPATIPFRGEQLFNTEGGVKWTVLGGQAHFDASVFHYSYHDYQAYLIIGTSQFVVNKDASSTGAEFTGDIDLPYGFNISSFLAFLNARVRGIELPAGEVANRDMPQAPKVTAGGALHWTHNLGGGKLSTVFDWKYNDSQYFDVFNAPVNYEPAYWTGDLRIDYALPGGHWDAAFFINNINNKAYRIAAVDITVPIGLGQSNYTPPRWFGGSVTYRF